MYKLCLPSFVYQVDLSCLPSRLVIEGSEDNECFEKKDKSKQEDMHTTGSLSHNHISRTETECGSKAMIVIHYSQEKICAPD